MKLTNEIVEQLSTRLRSGAPLDVACRAVGVDEAQLDAELRKTTKRASALRERLEQARASAEFANVALISRAARDGNWLAAAWLLERLYPDRYARPSQRADEKQQSIVVGSDRLDDLEKRRAARRARS